MLILRCPLVSFVALAVYLAANVAARGLHHHAEQPSSLKAPAAYGDSIHLDASPRADDGGANHACAICCGLHLAQALPTAVHAEAITDRTGEAATPAAVSCPHPIETPIHSRGPPTL
ncbi:MAG TPA: hypothetical protein VG013_32660 [Gemmataceae bacterium]|jgi:hypothetical protein|nr:hypothetical protein [Gemmataceae bacterium]